MKKLEALKKFSLFRIVSFVLVLILVIVIIVQIGIMINLKTKINHVSEENQEISSSLVEN